MASSRRRVALVLALILLTVLAGCSGAGIGGSGDAGDGARPNDGDGGAGGGGTDLGDGGFAGEPAQDGGSGGDGLPALQQRDIIYTGRVVLTVEDFTDARSNVTAAARANGGFVSDARSELHGSADAPWRTGEVVLRVPSENFTATMERVQTFGTVVSAEQNSQDVTDQLVDVEARLESLRTQRDRLRALYEQANTTEDVLAVEERLSAVQTEIERLEARQQSLERQVAYSTVTVELREEPPETEQEHWYDVGAVGAFLESVDGVVVTLRALVVAVAYLLPYLVVFGVPVVAVVWYWRRRNRV